VVAETLRAAPVVRRRVGIISISARPTQNRRQHRVRSATKIFRSKVGSFFLCPFTAVRRPSWGGGLEEGQQSPPPTIHVEVFGFCSLLLFTLSIQRSLTFTGPAFCRSFHQATIGRRSGAKPCERSAAEAALSRKSSGNFLVFLKLLGLWWRIEGEYKAANKQMGLAENRKYRVLPIVLNTGETLPTLVRRSNWIPVRVATGCAVRRRRFECMDSTLAHDLRALGLLYESAETKLRCDLDDLLETFVVPVGRQLDSLVTFWKPLPVPDRSLPRTRTGRNRMGRSASA